MQPDLSELRRQVVDLCAELDKRSRRKRLVEAYTTDECPIPTAIRRARVTQAYRMLMEFAQTNYGRLIVKAATSRMEVGGIRTGNADLDTKIWNVWQANRMDSESRLGHDCVLTHGRVFAIVWASDGKNPEITLEEPDTVVIEYREGSRYEKVAALRRWIDSDTKIPHATLYRPDGIYKFSGPKNSSGGSGTQWDPRTPADEEWPLPNGLGVVPAVEIATNRKLKAARYGYACGDFEGSLGLMDRINVLEFLRLVIAFTSGFPIRALIGEEILRDDSGNDIPPFELAADIIAQFENPNVKLEQLQATDLKGFGDAIDHDIEALAGTTQTPSYYLRSMPIQNVAADAIRAADNPLNGRVEDHKPQVGEGWEDMLALAAMQLPGNVRLPSTAELVWINRESRSLSERADAATKLATVMPWQAVAEIAFDATQEQINRWQDMRMTDQLLTPAPPAPGQ